MFVAPPETEAEARAWFCERFGVSRETMRAFDTYAGLLREWQARYNLVGPSTLTHIWTRHFADSAQIVSLAPQMSPRRWIDMGSGAGFPGVVIALLAGDMVTVVDSVGKKAGFLLLVRESLSLQHCVHVENVRTESLSAGDFNVLTARACAPLIKLFDWGLKSQAQSATWLLLKGVTAEAEIAEARRRFDFDCDLIQSCTDSRGRIVRATNVRGKKR